MTKIRLLLVGDGNHQFITNLTFELKKINNINLIIDIVSHEEVVEKNKCYYNKIYSISRKGFLGKIKGVRSIVFWNRYKRLIQNLPDYDFVHFHYIGSLSTIELFYKYFTAKVILSIWGSDLYRLKSGN